MVKAGARRTGRIGFGAIALLLGTASPIAHPIHTTYAEITQPTVPGKVTITFRGFEDDLTAAARAGTPTGHLDSVVGHYLKRQLSLTDARGRGIPLQVTGIRRTPDVLWFTFQSTGVADLTGGKLSNRVLTELHGDQVNLVQVKLRGRTRTLLFTAGEGPKAIDR